jgi:hypothetical protein
MKIYVNNFNLNSLPAIQRILTDILFETQNYVEVYTNESMYHVDDKNIYLLEAKDGEITVHKNYFNDISLIVDNSYFKRIAYTNINGNVHLHKKIKKNIFKLNSKSKLNFIIEMVSNLDNTAFIPNDVYFESYEIVDIKELFIKQELIEFLSLLN